VADTADDPGPLGVVLGDGVSELAHTNVCSHRRQAAAHPGRPAASIRARAIALAGTTLSNRILSPTLIGYGIVAVLSEYRPSHTRHRCLVVAGR
jgi:hypothetical protein